MSAATKYGIGTWDGDAFHPCFSEEAHRKYARMHLPVAPACNIQCRFCSRRYDCVNESRPGVTSRVLTAEEALGAVHEALDVLPNLSVVGIAGPGEPLANRETFEALRLVHAAYPDMTLCLATNGLRLPSHVEELASLGVEFLTVTVNALDPRIGADIYSWVRDDQAVLRGRTAFEVLSANQWEGLARGVEAGMTVKVNSVLIPGLNEGELPRIAEKAKGAGAFVMNVIPLRPVEGSEFGDRRSPTPQEIRGVREECERHLRQIRHCASCRADAIGLLGCDLSRTFYQRLGKR